MLWETSLLDPEEGIRFRGYSIPDVQASSCAAALPEAARLCRRATWGVPLCRRQWRAAAFAAAGRVPVWAAAG